MCVRHSVRQAGIGFGGSLSVGVPVGKMDGENLLRDFPLFGNYAINKPFFDVFRENINQIIPLYLPKIKIPDLFSGRTNAR